MVAVSQKAINHNLDNLLKIYPDLGEINLQTHDGDIHAEVYSPQVALEVSSSNRGTVTYYCRFKKGTVEPWDDNIKYVLLLMHVMAYLTQKGFFSSNAPPIDMTGWRFAFAVDMAAINVPEDAEDYEDVKSVINQPGDYSISRLYLDFNSKCQKSFLPSISLANSIHSQQNCVLQVGFIYSLLCSATYASLAMQKAILVISNGQTTAKKSRSRPSC